MTWYHITVGGMPRWRVGNPEALLGAVSLWVLVHQRVRRRIKERGREISLCAGRGISDRVGISDRRSECGGKNRSAPFEMRVGRGVRGRKSRSLTAFGMTSGEGARDASCLLQGGQWVEEFVLAPTIDGKVFVQGQNVGGFKFIG